MFKPINLDNFEEIPLTMGLLEVNVAEKRELGEGVNRGVKEKRKEKLKGKNNNFIIY